MVSRGNQLSFEEFCEQAEKSKTYVLKFDEEMELIPRDVEAIYLSGGMGGNSIYNISEFYNNVYKPLKLEFFHFEQADEQLPFKLSWDSTLDWFLEEKDLKKILKHCCDITLPRSTDSDDINDYFFYNKEAFKHIEQKIGLSLNFSETGSIQFNEHNHKWGKNMGDNSGVMDSLKGVSLIDTYTNTEVEYEVKVFNDYGCIVDKKFYVFDFNEYFPEVTIINVKD